MKTARLFSMLSLLGLAWAMSAAPPDEHNKKMGHGAFKATLTGAAESPGPGDPDGSGQVTMTVEAPDRLCFDVKVANIDPPTAAHVHKGVSGQSGPPVVTLSQVADGSMKNCVNADAKVIGEIKANPAGYYFNVHTAKYPDGAVRGQFKK